MVAYLLSGTLLLLPESLFNEVAETPTQVFSCELCEIFKNVFLASDYFSKYESLFMIAAVHSCL